MSKITFGAQFGDQLSYDIIHPHLKDIQKLLQEHCQGSYAKEVIEFGFVLRVDGDLWHWDKEGCERLRRSFKEKYITLDVMMPKKRWEKQDATAIREFLMNNVEEAFRLCVQRLEKDKVKVEKEKLMQDLQIVRKIYLNR